MGFLLLVARIVFSIIFISSGFNHIVNVGEMSEFARAKNVPMPKAAVFMSGIMLLLGGFSIILGAWVNIGALLLIIFLLPAAFMMHDFWTVDDPEARQNEQIHFFKNMSMAGAAFFIWYLYVNLEAVPWSITS